MKNLLIATIVSLTPLMAHADETENAACAGVLTWATQTLTLPEVVYDARNYFMQRYADDNDVSFVVAFEAILDSMDSIEELGIDLLGDLSLVCLDAYSNYNV